MEYCDTILQRKSVDILHAHQSLIEGCSGLLNADKRKIFRPLHTVFYTRYEINKELVENVRRAKPGRVVVSKTDPLKSVAEGKGFQGGDVGSEVQFVITTNNSHGKQCYDADDPIIVKVETQTNEELKHKIKYDKGGEHRVTYTPDFVGQHQVMNAVNSEPLIGSPWRFHVAPHRYIFLFSFGSPMKAQEEFDFPCGIAVNNKTGNVVVADHNNKRVQLFSSAGTFFKTMSAEDLIEPRSVVFTGSSDVLVIASRKMFSFNESGKLVKSISSRHLKKPIRLTIAHDGRVVVCDRGDNTVKVLSPDSCYSCYKPYPCFAV